jgi:hypothetical protein
MDGDKTFMVTCRGHLSAAVAGRLSRRGVLFKSGGNRFVLRLQATDVESALRGAQTLVEDVGGECQDVQLLFEVSE